MKDFRTIASVMAFAGWAIILDKFFNVPLNAPDLAFLAVGWSAGIYLGKILLRKEK